MDATVSVFDGERWVRLSTPLGATLLLTEAQHDSLVLDLVSDAVTVITAYPSAPVTVDLVHSGQRIIFYGYLDMAQPAVVAAVAPQNKVFLMGTTHVMRTSTARSWTMQWPTTIAQEVLRPYKLGLEMDSSEHPVDFLSQAQGESDWQLLCRLADTIGYSLSSAAGIVRMTDPTVELRRSVNRDYTSIALPRPNGQSNVSVFKVTSTTTPTGSDYRDTIMKGVDNLGQAFTYRTTFEQATKDIDPEFTVLSAKTFTCLGDAVLEAKRIRQQARFTKMAQAGITGYLPAQPGRYVNVIDSDGIYNGWWYCTDVQYAFNNQVGSTMLTLGYKAPSLSSSPIVISPQRPPKISLVTTRWQLDRDWTKIS